MVFVLKEKAARKVFDKYENVAAFTLGKSKGINDEELEITYSKLPFTPDEDTLNGIVDGTVKAKKVIKDAVKALHKPSTDSETYNVCITMAQLVNILYPEGKKNQTKKAKKRGPNIIVFVLDDNDENDKATKVKAKFLTKYVAALFAEFGIEVITDTKVVKKVFTGKKKKVVQRVSTFVANNKRVRINDKGHQLKKTLITFYAIELRQSALKGIEADDLSRNSIKTLLKTLIDTYTNDNMRVTAGTSKKEMKRTCKQLKKKNKAAVEAYEEFTEIMAVVNPDLKLPKVKNGYKGKKPKMNVNKFVNWFTKKGKKSGRIAVLLMIYAHTAAVLVGAEPGTSEYTKTMTNVVKSIGLDADFSKAFINAAKGQAKA
jgi:hypothetical protein